MKEFIMANWVNMALVIVGLSAIVIYILQERRKKIDAASLIILQIDDLQERLQEVSAYVIDRQLNATAFYESLPLMEENYWIKYKHYFVKEMDATSFASLNKFYNYVSVIQEQQTLMKNLQKNSFFTTQSALTSIEAQFLVTDLNNSITGDSAQQVVSSLINTIPQNATEGDRNTIAEYLRKMVSSNSFVDANQLIALFAQHKSRIVDAVNRSGFTLYIPEQIRLSLEKILKEYSLLTVIGSEGYLLLKKFSQKKV